MTTSQTIQLRLTLSPFHISHIIQQMNSLWFNFNKTSHYPTITAPNILPTIDLLQVNIPPVTKLPFYDNYSCTINIYHNHLPNTLILTLSFPQASILDPAYHIIPHTAQPDSISESILLFDTKTQTFPLPDHFKSELPGLVPSDTFHLPINSEDFS